MLSKVSKQIREIIIFIITRVNHIFHGTNIYIKLTLLLL
jgi:hypothetical protein